MWMYVYIYIYLESRTEVFGFNASGVLVSNCVGDVDFLYLQMRKEGIGRKPHRFYIKSDTQQRLNQ